MKNDEVFPLGVRPVCGGFGRSVLLALACVTLQAPGWATGGFEEYPLETLSDYLKLDQLPAKSAEQIHGETSKEAPEVAKINYASELMALTKKPGPEALASLDKMIVAARDGSELSLLNLLHDLRDLYAGPANAAETAAYVEWRMEQADQFGVSFDKPKPADADQERKAPNRELTADIERHLEKASPALKPHWLYLRGAVEYLGRQVPESQVYFLKVAKDFPKSPRAEAALYMAARTQMWKTRKDTYTQGDMQLVDAERPKAKKLWDEYFAKYPHGRFLGDALGWYAAYAYDGLDFGTALRCYAQQLDMTDHPELYAMAAEMVEKTLSHIASDPKDKAFAEVAKHPPAAQALVYLIINTREADNYNGQRDTSETVRGWRKKVLPRLATAISAESKLYQAAEWKPRYLAMLAYAASAAGQHDQALKLLQSAGALTEQSDDLLMANGVVLHRAKKPGDAAKALQTLLEKYPQSPLVKGARLRLALALTDDHRGGEAVLTLQRLLPKDSTPKADAPADAADKPDADKAQPEPEPDTDSIEDTGSDPILYGIDKEQISALIDTLLNFAPVEELAAAAQKPGLDPVLRLLLTEPIAQRLLAKEQFDEAKKYMTPAQFGLIAAGLEKLTTAARDAKDPAAHAAACLKLGDAWAEARGKLLTYPLDTQERREQVFISFSAEANQRRADSAPFIGAAGNYKLDLENRDELRHAFNWWLEASDAQPGTPQTAQALWRAMKAMPQVADVSPYTFDRAVSRKWGDVSRKLYDRLRTECPDTVEAKRYAVVWDFTPAKKNPDSEYVPHRGEAANPLSGSAALQIEAEDASSSEALETQIAALEGAAGGVDLAKVRGQAQALRSEVRKAYSGLYSARWVNLVDDLALFLSEPDPGVPVRERYAALRFRFFNKSAIGGGGFGDERDSSDEELRKEIDAALADPKIKPVADYFEFLKLAVTANHFVFVGLQEKDKMRDDLSKEEDTYRTRDYPKLAKEVQAFLEKYPKSKKREAALLLQARAIYRGSEQVELHKSVTWPRATRWEGGNEPTRTQQQPFDAKKVVAALDAYDKAFPHGLYAPDIRAYRAEVALRQREWKAALDLTLAQLNGDDNPALNLEAANRLGKLFAQIADERYRTDVFAAIKANPRARELLEKYLAADSDQHPLLYMKAWVRQQMAAK